MINNQTVQPMNWALVEFGDGEQQRRSIDLPMKHLIVGRGANADISIQTSGVSKQHALIKCSADELVVEDLKSTNGTFVNGERVQTAFLNDGDLVQFANAVYKIARRDKVSIDMTIEEGILPWAQTLLRFDALIGNPEIIPHFQKVIELDNQKTIGYELLARSDIEDLSVPSMMFPVAERVGQQVALSELMRVEGVRVANEAAGDPGMLLLNTHPSEVVTDRLIESLGELRSENPEAQLTIEIHEAAVTDLSGMQELRAALNDLDIRLSYDDFGAGQGRLVELTEIPPDILKFDMSLIRDIDTASQNRVSLLRSLVEIAKSAGAMTLAEGVESQEEHEVCLDLGFELGQGFLYGKPQPEFSS